MDLLSHPAKTVAEGSAAAAAQHSEGEPSAAAAVASITYVESPMVKQPPVTTPGLAAAWKASALFAAQMGSAPSAPHLKLEGACEIKHASPQYV